MRDERRTITPAEWIIWDLWKTPSFVQSLCQTQILILEILNVCLWLKFSSSLTLSKIEPFSKASIFDKKHYLWRDLTNDDWWLSEVLFSKGWIVLIRTYLKNSILVQGQGGAEIQATGILKYSEKLKRGPNTEIGPKDFFEIASTYIRRLRPFGLREYLHNFLVHYRTSRR